MQMGIPIMFETTGIDDSVRVCRGNGLDFVELNMNLPQYLPGRLDVSYFRSLAKQYKIGYTIHMADSLNPFDFDPRVAEAHLKTTLDTIAMAKELEIPILNMHMPTGVSFSMPNQSIHLYDIYKDEFCRNVRQFRDGCRHAIQNSDIRICIENRSRFTEFQRKAIDILLESPDFGLTFDVGNDHCTRYANESFILKRERRLWHMHIHDALDYTPHLPLGAGDVDLPKYMQMAEDYNCRVVLQTRSVDSLKRSLRWLRTMDEERE